MFFGHCHRTRFHDSFCLASVFEMTVYLLTYFDRSKMQSIGANGISFCGAYCSEVICERSGGKAGLAGLILVNL